MTEIETICPECGRSRQPGPTVTAADGSGDGSRRGMVVGLAVVLALGAAVLLLLPSRHDPDAGPPDGVGPVSDDRIGVPQLDDGTAPDPNPVEPATASTNADDLTLSAGIRAAYASRDGLVIVETATGAIEVSTVALVAPELAYVDPFILVADDRRTLAVHPAVPQEPFALASNYRLVATDVADQYVFVPSVSGVAEADEVFLGQAQDGSFGRPVSLPPGSSRLAASGVGILVAAPSGVTYEVGLAGLEPLSDASVIAAAGRHRLEVRCDSRLVCRTDVVDGRGGSTVLDDEVAAKLGSPTLSPDGEWVAGRDGTTLIIVEVRTGAVREIDVGDRVLALAWTPDADVLMALTGPPNTGRLAVVDLTRDEPVKIVDLGALGAPAPIGAGLVAF